MAKRHFVLLANKIKNDIDFGGKFASEKLNGFRCIWDGGISRGFLKKEIPWANISKDERYITEEIATGLWSRYGNVIHASDEFLDSLPKHTLDGELYTGYDSRQRLSRIIKPLTPDSEEWKQVSYKCFDVPSYESWFANGYVEDAKRTFKDCMSFVMNNSSNLDICIRFPIRFLEAQKLLALSNFQHEQRQLSHIPSIAKQQVIEWFESLPTGAEGIMLRDPQSFWCPHRTNTLLKYKPTDDMEVEIVGYNTGKETDKGSRHIGAIGSLIVKLPNGKLRAVSGLNDNERTLDGEATAWAINNPGQELPNNYEAIHFKRGDIVTILFRGFTEEGIPEEARYWRKYERL